MKEDGIRGAAHREGRAAEPLGITVDELREYAGQLVIGPRRMYGQKGSWYVVFELEEIADLMGLNERPSSTAGSGVESAPPVVSSR